MRFMENIVWLEAHSFVEMWYQKGITNRTPTAEGHLRALLFMHKLYMPVTLLRNNVKPMFGKIL